MKHALELKQAVNVLISSNYINPKDTNNAFLDSAATLQFCTLVNVRRILGRVWNTST